VPRTLDFRCKTRAPLRRAYRKAHTLFGRGVDRWLEVDTTEEVDLETLGLASPERVNYQPSGWLTLRRVLRPAEVGPADVFLDLGAGKGRVVLLAARYPFARVIGVELSESLAAVARRNVATIGVRPRCGPIEIVTADAVDFEIPDDVSVVYMNNAFRGSTFDAVIGNLLESVDRKPRRVRLIYWNADDRDRLARTGRFRLERFSAAPRLGAKWRAATAVRMYVLDAPAVRVRL
jgi:SAM-dependent methyltransferase